TTRTSPTRCAARPPLMSVTHLHVVDHMMDTHRRWIAATIRWCWRYVNRRTICRWRWRIVPIMIGGSNTPNQDSEQHSTNGSSRKRSGRKHNVCLCGGGNKHGGEADASGREKRFHSGHCSLPVLASATSKLNEHSMPRATRTTFG